MNGYYLYGGQPIHYAAQWSGRAGELERVTPDVPAEASLSDALSPYEYTGPPLPQPVGALELPSIKVLLALGAAAFGLWWLTGRGRRRNPPNPFVPINFFGDASELVALRPKETRPRPRKVKRRPVSAYVPAGLRKRLEKQARLRTAEGKRRSAAMKKVWRERKRGKRK